VTINSRKRTYEQSQLSENNNNSTPQQQLNRRAFVLPEQLSLRTNGSTTNGKGRISIVRTNGKNKLISWSDAPDIYHDILFKSTEATKYV
jgi:hypothetical protein